MILLGKYVWIGLGKGHGDSGLGYAIWAFMSGLVLYFLTSLAGFFVGRDDLFFDPETRARVV